MKKIVKFIAAHGIYVKGDVAGFEYKSALDLIHSKKVAVEHTSDLDADDGAGIETVTLKIDSAEAKAEIARQVDQAKADLAAEAQARGDALDAREVKLKEREDAATAAEATLKGQADDLVERERAIVNDEAALDKYAGELKAAGVDLPNPPKEPAIGKPSTTSAKPPKQGGK